MWNQLTREQQDQLSASAFQRSVSKGTVLHNGSADCTGLFLLVTGQLRAYMLSPEVR